MARGWESKSVEEQIDMAGRSPKRPAKPVPTENFDLIRKKETLSLSRTRILREIAAAQNPRYQEVLKKALADLDSQLGSLTMTAGVR